MDSTRIAKEEKSCNRVFARLEKWRLRKQMGAVFCLAVVGLILVCATSVLYFGFHNPLGVVLLVAVSFSTLSLFIISEQKALRWRRIWVVAQVSTMIPGIVWLNVFLFCFVCWLATSAGFRGVSSQIRFPLAHPEGLAVDSQGRVYCISSFYNRLQVFDANGSFVRGWFVNIPNSAHHLTIDPNTEHVRVAIQKTGVNFFFDIDGRLVGKKIRKDYLDEFGAKSPIKAEGVLGNSYMIKHAFLFPRIVRRNPDGRESVIAKDPFGLWLVAMPLPGFAFLVAFACISEILHKRRKRGCGV